MARNERLSDAMRRAGLTPVQMGEKLKVDPKTVERWVHSGRIPYPRNRTEIATLLNKSETWLWPHAVSAERMAEASRSEVVVFYSHRYLIPGEFWTELIGGATTFLDILVYAGLFLPEQSQSLTRVLADKADDGVRVRALLGDPNSEAAAIRGREEGIGDAVAVKMQNALHLYRELRESKAQVRLHGTTLYTSIYRSDDDMIANQHVLGLPAAQSPAVHLRKLAAGDMFDTYTACFDRVWETARTAWP